MWGLQKLAVLLLFLSPSGFGQVDEVGTTNLVNAAKQVCVATRTLTCLQK